MMTQYETTVEYHSEWDGNWRLTAIRLSDGTKIESQYHFQESALRRARSPRKLRRMFKRHDAWEAKKAARSFLVEADV